MISSENFSFIRACSYIVLYLNTKQIIMRRIQNNLHQTQGVEYKLGVSWTERWKIFGARKYYEVIFSLAILILQGRVYCRLLLLYIEKIPCYQTYRSIPIFSVCKLYRAVLFFKNSPNFCLPESTRSLQWPKNASGRKGNNKKSAVQIISQTSR